jgi:hypothetical protein
MNKFEKRITKMLVPPKASMESFRRKKPNKGNKGLESQQEFDAVLPPAAGPGVQSFSTVPISGDGDTASNTGSVLYNGALGIINRMSSFIAAEGHQTTLSSLPQREASILSKKSSAIHHGINGVVPETNGRSHKASVTASLALAATTGTKFPTSSSATGTINEKGRQAVSAISGNGSSAVLTSLTSSKAKGNTKTDEAPAFIPFVSTMDDHIKSLARKVKVTTPTIDAPTEVATNKSIVKSVKEKTASVPAGSATSSNTATNKSSDSLNDLSKPRFVNVSATVGIHTRT